MDFEKDNFVKKDWLGCDLNLNIFTITFFGERLKNDQREQSEAFSFLMFLKLHILKVSGILLGLL